jgi:DNA-binding response OmpR family regulator
MGRRILIVDDESTILQTLRIIFEDAGYEVLTAGTPSEALRLFQAETLDLVLLDYRLPDNGESVGPEMKRMKPAVPILLLSGDPEAASASSFAVALIAKPIQPPELLAQIAALFDNMPGHGGPSSVPED